ncbi:unnamed protein product [Pedinophyceae sp. YPF-701]|nr:unnamed protein product [Pedinophyceae sp. YPF-701]
MLEVSGLRRDVRGQASREPRTVIYSISFSLRKGEILFVRGPSGVGKTLLLRAIASLDASQGGAILLDGRTPSQYGFPSWRARVAYVPQHRLNFPGTPSELYFKAQSYKAQKGRPRGDLPSIVQALGLAEDELNVEWHTLSGGQANRVYLALVLALQPDVLLLDEPTGSLDPAATQRVEDLIQRVAKGGTSVVWVTHDVAQPSRVGGRVLELPLGTEIAA